MIFPITICHEFFAAKSARELLFASMGPHMLKKATSMLEWLGASVENTNHFTVCQLWLILRVRNVSFIHFFKRDPLVSLRTFYLGDVFCFKFFSIMQRLQSLSLASLILFQRVTAEVLKHLNEVGSLIIDWDNLCFWFHNLRFSAIIIIIFGWSLRIVIYLISLLDFELFQVKWFFLLLWYLFNARLNDLLSTVIKANGGENVILVTLSHLWLIFSVLGQSKKWIILCDNIRDYWFLSTL